MSSYILTLLQKLPLATCPRFADVKAEDILLNNVILPRAIDSKNAYNPHNVRLGVIGNEHGAICAVWASHEHDAFDCAVDANKLDCMMADDQDYDNESLTPLGNASELFDLSYAWIGEVEFEASRDIQLIIDIVRASEQGLDNLGGLK